LDLACQSVVAWDCLCTPGFHYAWEILSLICDTISHFAYESEKDSLCVDLLLPVRKK